MLSGKSNNVSDEDLHLISGEYLGIAAEVLIEAQRKLKWGYVYAYFFPRLTQEKRHMKKFGSPVFLDELLRHLEGAVEDLAELIELKRPKLNATLLKRIRHKENVVKAIAAVRAAVAMFAEQGSGPPGNVPSPPQTHGYGITVGALGGVKEVQRTELVDSSTEPAPETALPAWISNAARKFEDGAEAALPKVLQEKLAAMRYETLMVVARVTFAPAGTVTPSSITGYGNEWRIDSGGTYGI
eukprot:SAG31_NODE_8350_length_1468_cov_1.474799_1_plen_240_part_10